MCLILIVYQQHMKGWLNAVSDFGAKLGNSALNAIKGTVTETATELAFEGQLKLRLAGCCYSQTNKVLVEKAALRVHQDYKLDCGSISINMNGRSGFYIELSGNIPVNYKGATYPVFIKLMFPEYFPNQPPFIRVINNDPERYAVIEEFKIFQSPIDPNSYPLNNLASTKTWNATSDANMIIMETQQLLSLRFPFRRKGNETTPTNPSPSFPTFPANPMISSTPTNQTNQTNPTNSTNPTKPTFPQTSPFKVTSPKTNANPLETATATPQNKQARQKLLNCSANAQKLRQNCQKDITFIQNNYTATLVSIQRTEEISKCLADEIGILKEENQKLKTFIQEADRLGEVDLKAAVVPADQRSKDLIELLATRKALDSVIFILEGKFKDSEIDLETFMKLIRKYEEERFESTVLLKILSNR